MLFISNFVLDLINKYEVMKKSIAAHLPLMAITGTIIIAGIEVFQTGEENLPGMRTAEMIFVFMLAILIGLGITISIRRARSIAKGMPVDDELSRLALRASAATTFFLSLLLWIGVLILEVHTTIETKFLIGIGLLVVCLIFMILWAIKTFPDKPITQ